MNNKSKVVRFVKLGVLLFLMIGLLVYMTIYLTAVLTGTIKATTVVFGLAVIKNIIMDKFKLRILFSIVMVEFSLFLYFSLGKPDYKSKKIKVTPKIYIPEPAGQGQCGTARFLREDEFENAFCTQIIPQDINLEHIDNYIIPSGGIVLGKKDTRKGEKVYYIDTDTHVMCLGATRSGKTRCEVLETIGFLGLAGESMILTDIKGELSDYTRPYLERLGYEVKIINYSEPQYSDQWNYLQPIIDFVDAGDIPAAIDETWGLVSQLVGEPKGERLWNDGEASMIAASIMAVVYENREGAKRRWQNFANVYYFLVNMCKEVTIGKSRILPLSIFMNSLPDTHPAKGLLGVADVAPDRTRGSFFTSAIMTLKHFTNPYIANMSSASNFNPIDLGRKKMAVFLVLPDDRTTYHSLATLFVSQAYTILSKEAERNGGRLKKRVNVVADEFGNFSKMTNFAQQMTVGGGKGFRYLLFIQGFAQTEEKYEKTGAEILRGNCETWIYLQSDDPGTRKEISEKLGNYTTRSYSTSVNSNSTSTRVTSTGTSNNLIGRALLTPDEVGRIKRPYSLVTSREYPAIMYAPDVSAWSFNKLFGMGNKEHNIKLRVERRSQRIKHDISQEIDLWGIWTTIIGQAKQKQRENELRALAAKMAEEQKESIKVLSHSTW